MGQEISQQNKCNTSKRQQQQPFPQQQQHQQLQQHQKQQQLQTPPATSTNFQHYQDKPAKQTFKHNNNSSSSGYSIPTKPRYKPHKDLIYTSSSISNASSTDDEFYRQRQKYNLTKQTYEKAKISKTQLGSRKSLDSHSSTSDYQSSVFETAEELYDDIKGKYKRKTSQSTDSGIYYSSCHCTPTRFSSSAASVASGGTTSLVSAQSSKSLQKQKDYLEHHLYIKSYLDILEEDQKAKAQYKVAKPGGIRNYTPKILAEVSLSSSAPEAKGSCFGKQKGKAKIVEVDANWI